MVGVERLLASTAIRAKVRSGMGTGRARVGAGRGAGSDKRPTIKMRTTTRAAASATRLAVALVRMAMYHSRSGRSYGKRLDRSRLGPRQETAACALISIRERHAGAAKLAAYLISSIRPSLRASSESSHQSLRVHLFLSWPRVIFERLTKMPRMRS